MNNSDLKSLLDVFMTLQVTKELPRQGFINFGFKRNESDSVAAHSYTVTAFAFLLALSLKKEGWQVDESLVLKMALLHDMGEAISGDVGYHVKRFAGDMFHQVEMHTFGMLVESLAVESEVKDLFVRYNKMDTLEAKVVKCADVLDAYLQMHLTPGADMHSVDMFMSEKTKSFGGDDLFGDQLVDIFERAVKLIKEGSISFLGT